MENSLSPAFVRINYSSLYGVHTMTIPSVPYNVPTVGAITGTFDLRGGEIDTPAGPAITDYVNLLRDFFPASVTFIDYLIYTQVDPETPATPQYSASLGIAGTVAVPGWSKAVQTTITWRTDQFGLFKAVLLDSASRDNYDKVTAPVGGLATLSAYVTDDSSWIAGRDGGAPKTFLQMALTLNEKLRRAYRMN